MLKKVGLAVFAILISTLSFPLVMQDKARVGRTVTIHQKPATVFAFLADFNQFRSWNPWTAMEPSSESTVEGTGVGSSYTWLGDKTGHGRMTITQLKEPTEIAVKMNFYEPVVAEALVYWKLKPTADGGTEVKWEFEQPLSYFQRYLGLTMDSMMGPSFEQGLTRLKERMEAIPLLEHG